MASAPTIQREDAPISIDFDRGALAARLVDAVKVYGDGDTAVRALDGITVAFDHGRFTSVMGASGSGKSTLLQCAAALDDLTSGQAFIADTDLSGLNDRRRCALRRTAVGFVFQSFNLVPALTAAENVTLPLDLAGVAVDREWFDHVTGAVGIAERLTHQPHELSGGQQQRVAVARALLPRPAVVFADEPTGNLDSRSGAEVLSLLRTAVDQFAQTVVMVTHDPSAAAVSDEVIFMADGRLHSQMTAPTVSGILDALSQAVA